MRYLAARRDLSRVERCSIGRVIDVFKAAVVFSTLEISSISLTFLYRHIAVLNVVTSKKSDGGMVEVI